MAQVIAYLTGGSPARPLQERLVAFLVQIDFWDWEMENLIYSFGSFAERSQAWEFESGQGLANGLKSRGIWIRFGAVKGIKGRRKSRGHFATRVVAPVDALNSLIEKWNALLAACEEHVLIPGDERQRASELGAYVLLDLARYRKTPLE
jgi:hypothetical protein